MARRVDAFAIIGDPALNRVQLFAAAISAAGETSAIVSYRDVFSEGSGWRAKIAGKRVRLESPGRDFAIERALLARGAKAGVEPGFSQLPAEHIDGLQRDPGQVFATRQWYLGYADMLQEITASADSSGATCLNAPADIAVMFDKRACHARLAAARVPVPRALCPPESFEHLIELMEHAGMKRVFVKTCHGSAANGVLALELQGCSFRGATALELNSSKGRLHLYATKKLRVYRDRATLQPLVDALCREPVHVENWVPKAGVDGRAFDIRVVVIRGRACHLMLRLAPGPITNLHLHGSIKGSEQLLSNSAGEASVTLARETAERAAACFPKSLCVGVDVALTPSYRQARVLEVNAFGDLLEGVTWRGADTYTWAVRAALDRGWPPD